MTIFGPNYALIWDATSGAFLMGLKNDSALGSAVFSPDSAKVLTIDEYQSAQIWDASSGTKLSILQGHKFKFRSAVFSPDCSKVLTASIDKTVRIWDASSGAELLVLHGHTNYVDTGIFSLDGAKVLTVSGYDTVRIWDTSTGKELACLPITGRVFWAVPYQDVFIVHNNSGETLFRWSDGTQISDADPPLECPARPTLISKDGGTGLSLRVRGLPAFAPPVLHLGTGFFTFQVNPTDPLSFVAGCADGSVRFFRLEGVELPVTH
jgi:WD40 repeat protein